MDISHNHHNDHHVSPVAIVAVVAGLAVLGLAQGGYLKGVFHKEILARVDPATVLVISDAAPQARRAIAPAIDGAPLAEVRQ